MMAGIMSAVAAGLSRKATTYELGTLWEYVFGNGSPSKSGVFVTPEEALRCTTALACVRALSDGIAQSDWGIYKRSPDGRGLVEARDHPLWRVLHRQPNSWMTSFEFREAMMVHATLTGNGIAYINRVRGRVTELIPFTPGQVAIEQLPDYRMRYRVTLPNSEYKVLEQSDVLHIRGKSWNTYEGLDTLRMAREAIGLSVATEETHARYHANGARPGGVLSSDSRLTKEQVEAIKAQWQATYGGTANDGRTAVLGSGLKWQQIAMTGVDAQHLETRRFQIEEVCRGMGVYPAVIGHSDKASTYASVESFFLQHVRLSLAPWATRFEQACDRDILSDREKAEGYETNIDLRGLERGDTRARMEYYASGITNGWLTRNEARVEEGFNPLSGLDEPLAQLNMGAATGSAAKPAVSAA